MRCTALAFVLGCAAPAATPAAAPAPPPVVLVDPAPPLPVAAPEPEPAETVALVLVIDRSGSMTGLPLEMAKRACIEAVRTVADDTWVMLVMFDARPDTLVEMRLADDDEAIAAQINRINPGGGTEIVPALEAAHVALRTSPAVRKRVLLLTDGRAPTNGLGDLLDAMRADGVVITTVGLGDVDVEMLQTIASGTGGRFHPVTDPADLVRVFREEATQLTGR
jgi:uncharacterized protein with von Willebrand factor type A (vWA) domain